MACGAGGRADGGGRQAVRAHMAQYDRWFGWRAARTIIIHRLLLYKARAVSLPASETQVQMLLTRYCLATRLNCLTRHLPSVVFQPAFRIVDDLLVATADGCAGKDSATNLTAATQGRALLAMRSGCVLPCAVTTAPAKEVSSVAAVERFISEIEAAHLAARHGNKRTSVGAGAH